MWPTSSYHQLNNQLVKIPENVTISSQEAVQGFSSTPLSYIHICTLLTITTPWSQSPPSLPRPLLSSLTGFPGSASMILWKAVKSFASSQSPHFHICAVHSLRSLKPLPKCHFIKDTFCKPPYRKYRFLSHAGIPVPLNLILFS